MVLCIRNIIFVGIVAAKCSTGLETGLCVMLKKKAIYKSFLVIFIFTILKHKKFNFYRIVGPIAIAVIVVIARVTKVPRKDLRNLWFEQTFVKLGISWECT